MSRPVCLSSQFSHCLPLVHDTCVLILVWTVDTQDLKCPRLVVENVSSWVLSTEGGYSVPLTWIGRFRERGETGEEKWKLELGVIEEWRYDKDIPSLIVIYNRSQYTEFPLELKYRQQVGK